MGMLMSLNCFHNMLDVKVNKCRIHISYYGFLVRFLHLISYSTRQCFVEYRTWIAGPAAGSPDPRACLDCYCVLHDQENLRSELPFTTWGHIQNKPWWSNVRRSRWSKVPIAVSSPSSVPLEAINLPLTNLLIEQFATRVPVLEKRPVRRGTKQKRTSPPLVAFWQAGQVISRCSQISRLVGWPWYALSFWCNICKSQVVKFSAFFIRGRFCSTHLLQGRVLNHEDGKTCAWLFYSEFGVYCSGACRWVLDSVLIFISNQAFICHVKHSVCNGLESHKKWVDSH